MSTRLTGIHAIRYKQRGERWIAPKKLTEALLNVMGRTTPSALGKLLVSQERQLYTQIRSKWDTIFEDSLFAYCEHALMFYEKKKITTGHVYQVLIGMLEGKLPSARPVVSIQKLELVCHSEAPFTTTYGETVYKGTVSGLSRFAGVFKLKSQDGHYAVVKVYPKFISHPFFQYGSSTKSLVVLS